MTKLNTGKYNITVPGHNGSIEFEIVFSDGKIEDIRAVESTETTNIGDNAIETTIGNILEAQSLNIDTVSGATVSSHAALQAVSDAIEEAGGDPSDFQKEYKPKAKEDVHTEADVVIVGAGGAGLAAAITAKEAGHSVIVLEKQNEVGGSTNLSAGALIASLNSEDEKYSPSELAQHWKTVAGGHINHDIADKMAAMSGDTIEFLEDIGLEFTLPESTYLGFDYNVISETVDDRNRIITGVGGTVLIDKMLNRAEELDIEILRNTPVKEILTENDKIIGVKAEGSQKEEIIVHGKVVIIASGGFNASPEMMYEIDPSFEGTAIVGGGGNTGDAVKMAEPLDAKISFGGEIGLGSYGGANPLFSVYQPGMYITDRGERFMDETDFYGPAYCNMRDQYKLGVEKFYDIHDGNSPYLEDLEAGVEEGNTYKADTLEELAELINVDADALVETANKYSEDKGKADSEFGKPAEWMRGTEESPFYAFEIFPLALGTIGGLQINENAELIDNNNEPIEGLYGAGDAVNGVIFHNVYPYSGTGIQFAISSGRLATESVLNYIK